MPERVAMSQPPIGIIGGSGLYKMAAVEVIEELSIDTPFGPPSDKLIHGKLGGRDVLFLARHGRGHYIAPSQLNYRANIFALKELGVEYIVSVSAVGSMREEIAPGHVVVIDQFFDRTRERPSTFFDEYIVAHITFAHPIAESLRKILIASAQEVGATVHSKGTYLCMEGPQFSTKAESEVYRQWGMDVIGMTNLQEAKLAREAEIAYATLAMSTDYDCWHEDHDAVTVEQVIALLNHNSHLAQEILMKAIPQVPDTPDPDVCDALKNAILTDKAVISKETVTKLQPILGKYFL